MKLLALALFFITPILQAQSQAQNQPQPRAQTCPHASHISLDSGTFSSQPGVTFTLRHFVATLVPRTKVLPTCLEKDTVMTRGEIFVSNESLTEVFTSKLSVTESKIQGFKVRNGVGQVTLSGHITKIVPIDFSIVGPVTTDGTSLLLDASKIKADGIPIKALLGMVGEHLSAVLKLNGVPGITVTDNKLAFSPEQIAHLKGHIESVETTDKGIILRYSTPRASRK